MNTEHRDTRPAKSLHEDTAPFHPFHLAAIAWIFLQHEPGMKEAPDAQSNLPYLPQALSEAITQSLPVGIQAAVAGNLNDVFDKLNQFTSASTQNKADFEKVKGEVQDLMLRMKNLWTGRTSTMTAKVVVDISAIPPR